MTADRPVDYSHHDSDTGLIGYYPVVHERMPTGPGDIREWLCEKAILLRTDSDDPDLYVYARHVIGWDVIGWDDQRWEERCEELVALASEVHHAEVICDRPRLSAARDEYERLLTELAQGPHMADIEQAIAVTRDLPADPPLTPSQLRVLRGGAP